MSSHQPGRFRRMLRWLGRGDDRDAVAELPQPADEPVTLKSPDEEWLANLATAVGEGTRFSSIGDREFWRRIDALWAQGNERVAIEWIEKFIHIDASDDDTRTALRVRLVDMLDQRGNTQLGLNHLQALTFHADHGVRAHYLLGEHYRRVGDEALALRHYEAVLARDLDYPNVRIRVERLRAARGGVAPAAAGETIAEPAMATGTRYRLIRELGRGASGVVYQSRDCELERDVAIKLLHPHLAAIDNADAVARFFSEARIAASLRHPNIIAVLDIDERARRIVMELAAGGTLREHLDAVGAISPVRALTWHTHVLAALAAAHRRGVVHRDVKPANLMFRRAPTLPGTEVVLSDFGIAHLPGAEAKGAVGTLAYMPPRQRVAHLARSAWDLYAAAVVLFELLMGRYPWSRAVLLSGERKRGDFALDRTVDLPDELREPLSRHLDLLGVPDDDARPTTEQALTAALELTDLAVAAGLDVLA